MTDTATLDYLAAPLGVRQHNGLVRTIFFGDLLTSPLNVASLAIRDRFVNWDGAVYEVTNLQWRVSVEQGLRINCYAAEVGPGQKPGGNVVWLDEDPILPINRIVGCRR